MEDRRDDDDKSGKKGNLHPGMESSLGSEERVGSVISSLTWRPRYCFGAQGSWPRVERDFPGPPRAATSAALRFSPMRRAAPLCSSPTLSTTSLVADIQAFDERHSRGNSCRLSESAIRNLQNMLAIHANWIRIIRQRNS